MIIYADLSLGCVRVNSFLDAEGAMVEAPEYFLAALSALKRPTVSEVSAELAAKIHEEYGITGYEG